MSQSCLYTVKNIRILTNIWWRVFHILTEPVPYTLVSVNRRNNKACNVDERFTIPSIYGDERMRNRFR